MSVKLLAVAACLLGACLLVTGLALIWPPLAFLGAGAGLLAGGLLVPFEPPARPGRRR